MRQGIAKSASRLRWGVLIAAGLLLAQYVAARFGVTLGHLRIEYRGNGGPPQFAGAIGDGTMLLLLIAVFQLVRMLRLVEQGDNFSAPVTRRFRGFAFWLLLMALFSFLAPIVAELASHQAGPRHHIRVPFDTRELLLVGITLLLFLIARLLERAGEIEHEMSEIV